MDDIVNLRGQPVPIDDDEFIENLARYADGTLTEAAVKSKYDLDDSTWEKLGSCDKLVEAIEAAKWRRIRSGATKREKAQLLIVQAPDVLGTIMLDAAASPKHRIDSAKVLDQFATGGAEAAAAGARFEITINLGADHIEHYSKSIDINPNDTDEARPQVTLAAIAASKPKGGGDGEPL